MPRRHWSSTRVPPLPRGTPRPAGQNRTRLLSVLKATLTAAPCSPHALTSARAAPHPTPRSGGALGTEGPCCGHKVGFFHAKSNPSRPRQCPCCGGCGGVGGRRDWLGTAGPCRGAGGDRTVPKCPSVAIGLWQPRHGAAGVTTSCASRVACGPSWQWPGVTSCPCLMPRGCHQPSGWIPNECLRAKPRESGALATGKVAARHTGPSRHRSDREVTWDAPAPRGHLRWWPWPVSGSQAAARDPACASAAARATSAPDVGSALASPRRSGSTAGRGGASGW